MTAPSISSGTNNASEPAPPVENAETGKLLVGAHWCELDGPLERDFKEFRCYVVEKHGGSLDVKDGPAGKVLGTVTGEPGNYRLKWHFKPTTVEAPVKMLGSPGSMSLIAEKDGKHGVRLWYVKIKLDVIKAKY